MIVYLFDEEFDVCEVVDLICSVGCKVVLLLVDICSEGVCNGFVEWVVVVFGGFDIFVNNVVC